MAVNGPQMIGAVLEHLRTEDVELLLANRGLPYVGGKEELSERLQSALQAEICEWEWEAGEVPDFHCGELSVFEEWSACHCCSTAYDTLVTCLSKHGFQLAGKGCVHAHLPELLRGCCAAQKWLVLVPAWQHIITASMCLVAWMRKGQSTCTYGDGISAARLALNLSLTGKELPQICT